MALITQIGLPPRVTVDGPPPNFDKVTQIGTGYSMSTTTPGEIGGYITKELRIASVSNNAAAVVEDSFIAEARMRVVNFEIVAQAVTATTSALLYNSTQAANVAPAATPTTTPTLVTAFTTPTVEANDIVQLKVTTDGTGAVTNLVVKLTVQYLGAPSNAQA